MATLQEIGPALPQLAREVLECFLSTGRMPMPPARAGVAAPVFVTLHGSDSRLRGCIGTLEAQHVDVTVETAHNAVSAATRDPRFTRVGREELPGLRIDVTVLSPLEAVTSLHELDPQRFGLLLCGSGARQGVLLPDLHGVEDVATQMRIVRQKARIGEHEEAQMFRFLAERFTE